MKLDKIDKKILYELDKYSRIPDTKLAKIVGRSKESVRYRIKQLQEKGIIKGFSIWIDPTKFGHQTAKIYLNLANIPDQKKDFIKYVNNDKRLLWLGIAEGAWNAGLTYFVKDTREFFDIKNDLFSKFRDLILESHTAILVSLNKLDKTFFYETEKHWKTMADKLENTKLEEIEKKILIELSKNSRINIVDIARKHKTTVDIVKNRMRRLEENKIIFRYTAIINHNKLGHEFFKTFLYFKNLNKEDEERLMEYTRKIPEMVHLVKQISPWDVELEIMCENYLDYNKIIANLTKEFSNIIQKVETAIMEKDYVFPAEQLIFE
ncbi:Lrp/AsnC family transcriptional regulator [Candidatus Woesearchaeota archaeon]|nr:Lrp/AsnC family transcriptional regulator [Candidatus Woesearchaeota archaeon]